MTQASIARDLELAPRTIREWMDRGVIPHDCPDSLTAAKALIRHYQGVVSGHRSSGAGGGEILDLTEERAKLAKAQAETAELRNAELRGELIRRDELVSTWSSHVLSWKERVRAIPASATVHIPAFTAAMGRALLALIDETLVELADGKYEPGERPPKRARRGTRTPPTAA